MTALCPVCNQQIAPLTLLVCLGVGNLATRRGRTVRLAPQQAVMLHTLLARQPAAVTCEDLAKALWGIGTNAPDNERQRINELTRRLRRTVAPLGVSIENKHATSYRLVLDAPQHAEAMA